MVFYRTYSDMWPKYIAIQMFTRPKCCHQVFWDRMSFSRMILTENVGHRRLTRYEFIWKQYSH